MSVAMSRFEMVSPNSCIDDAASPNCPPKDSISRMVSADTACVCENSMALSFRFSNSPSVACTVLRMSRYAESMVLADSTMACPALSAYWLIIWRACIMAASLMLKVLSSRTFESVSDISSFACSAACPRTATPCASDMLSRSDLSCFSALRDSIISGVSLESKSVLRARTSSLMSSNPLPDTISASSPSTASILLPSWTISFAVSCTAAETVPYLLFSASSPDVSMEFIFSESCCVYCAAMRSTSANAAAFDRASSRFVGSSSSAFFRAFARDTAALSCSSMRPRPDVSPATSNTSFWSPISMSLRRASSMLPVHFTSFALVSSNSLRCLARSRASDAFFSASLASSSIALYVMTFLVASMS